MTVSAVDVFFWWREAGAVPTPSKKLVNTFNKDETTDDLSNESTFNKDETTDNLSNESLTFMQHTFWVDW